MATSIGRDPVRWRRVAVAFAMVITCSGGLAAEGSAAAWAAPTQWQSVPNSAGGNLAAVSCSSATFCVAVGYDATQAVIKMWNGAAFSTVDLSEDFEGLSAVSCVSPTFCTAVGYVRTSQFQQTLIDMWDGTSWSTVPSPNRGSRDSFLYGVSCTSPTACITVGGYMKLPTVRTLIESWDGTSWSITPSPSDARRGDYLTSVSCATATNCLAVGRVGDAGVTARPLAESWDGIAWSVLATPRPKGYSSFNSISCLTATDCVVVATLDDEDHLSTFGEIWDGASWTKTPTPNPGHSLDGLSSVSCTSTTSCVAVGEYDAGPHSKTKALIVTWDGITWSRATGANSNAPYSLAGVSCIDDATCFAVGGELTLEGS